MCVTGLNTLEVAETWPNQAVFNVMKKKWDTLPPLDEKGKKRGKSAAKKGGSAKSRPKTASSV